MLSFLFSLIALCTALISASDSQVYTIKTSQSSFLYATRIDNCTYKISTLGEPGWASRFQIHDVQNINNATVHAPEIDPNAILDFYKVREGGVETAQVFLRTNLTAEEIRGTQQISIADAHLTYYTNEFGFVFYLCEMPILTNDARESTQTLFIRRTEVCLPVGCEDIRLDVTRQGVGRR